MSKRPGRACCTQGCAEEKAEESLALGIPCPSAGHCWRREKRARVQGIAGAASKEPKCRPLGMLSRRSAARPRKEKQPQPKERASASQRGGRHCRAGAGEFENFKFKFQTLYSFKHKWGVHVLAEFLTTSNINGVHTWWSNFKLELKHNKARSAEQDKLESASQRALQRAKIHHATCNKLT